MTAKLALALSKAQGQMQGAKKDADNPFFKSKYADLASVWEACRKALSDNELSVAQIVDADESGMFLKTVLLHSSGEKLEGRMPINFSEKTNAQQIGSIITYYRRYALSAIVGVSPEDDDGNSASQVTLEKPPIKSNAQKFGSAKPGETDELKNKVKSFVKELEMSETSTELERSIQANDKLIQDVEEKLPAEWASRMHDKIAECRASFGV